MNINHKCTNCGSDNIRVRTSEKVGMLVIQATAYCNNCGTELKVLSEIVRVRTPTYTERPEALTANKPLNQIDPRQLDFYPRD